MYIYIIRYNKEFFNYTFSNIWTGQLLEKSFNFNFMDVFSTRFRDCVTIDNSNTDTSDTFLIILKYVKCNRFYQRRRT